jgi:hypothetical protein
MNFNRGLVGAGIMAAMIAVVPTAANATIATVFDDIDGGVASFNAIVSGAGATPSADVISSFSGTIYNGTGYTVTRPNNSFFTADPYTIWNSNPSRQLSGSAFDIGPAGTGPGHGAGDPNDTKNSGIQFNFAAGVNSIGFEVGDWGTCCQVSNLYISFDGGAPILVGSSTAFGDVFLTNGGAGVFVAAFDDSGTFTQVNFWGDGFGEVLVAGGTIRSADIDEGSLPPTGVPEPLTLTLFGAGLLGAGALRRRMKAKA